jgi:hypothetical protein
MKKRNPTLELDKASLERLQNTGSPLSREEIQFLEDLKAFIDFGIRNGLTFLTVMEGIGHDVDELRRDRFDFHAALKRGFWPKVSGYSRINADSVQSGEDE